jgi:hypothetical protein
MSKGTPPFSMRADTTGCRSSNSTSFGNARPALLSPLQHRQARIHFYFELVRQLRVGFIMLNKTAIRAWLHRRIFRGPEASLTGMRTWAFLSLTAYLAVVWKWLAALEKLYPDTFWRAVFGPDPIRELGPAGFVLLAFYVAGAAVWGMVTIGLAAIGKAWADRLVAGRRRQASPEPAGKRLPLLLQARRRRGS